MHFWRYLWFFRDSQTFAGNQCPFQDLKSIAETKTGLE